VTFRQAAANGRIKLARRRKRVRYEEFIRRRLIEKKICGEDAVVGLCCPMDRLQLSLLATKIRATTPINYAGETVWVLDNVAVQGYMCGLAHRPHIILSSHLREWGISV